ncbi:MAG: trimethylamine methyltransferase family protein [Desulfobacula sp.]|nr:trimethylamine methyltransferase family protein [Desulfobacula sp.]
MQKKNGELIGFLEMLANTKKPITLLISDPETFKHCLLMSDLLVGEKATQSSIIPYFNPITPLILNQETTLKIDLTVSRGMPFIFSNYGMSGATCPITPGGTLAVLLAELLAGLVYGQLLREGTPIILGSLPAAFDMKSMQSFYTPQSMMINLCCAEMMRHYDIPHCGTSGGGMGRGPDLLSGSMLWMNHLTSILGSPGLVPFVGNNFDSLAFSPATVVYAAEIIRLARDFSRGFSLDTKEVGLEEIIGLGPGASYLTSNLTMEKFKDPLTKSDIWPYTSLDKWKDAGCPKIGKELRQYTHDLLEKLTSPDDHDQILEAGEEYMRSLSCSENVKKLI